MQLCVEQHVSMIIFIHMHTQYTCESVVCDVVYIPDTLVFNSHQLSRLHPPSYTQLSGTNTEYCKTPLDGRNMQYKCTCSIYMYFVSIGIKLVRVVHTVYYYMYIYTC